MARAARPATPAEFLHYGEDRLSGHDGVMTPLGLPIACSFPALYAYFQKTSSTTGVSGFLFDMTPTFFLQATSLG